jgi:hypothetical protein
MHTPHEQLAGDMRNLLTARLAAATVQTVFRDKGDTKLALMSEPDGKLFVLREYSSAALAEFENDSNGPHLSFVDALNATQDMYAAADIPVVKTSVLPIDSSNSSKSVIGEYVRATPIRKAPLETKQKAIRGLARLMDRSTPYVPGPQALTSDLFVATENADGESMPIVVDFDPWLMPKKPTHDFGGVNAGVNLGVLMLQSAYMMEMWSQDDNERTQLARVFLGELATVDHEKAYGAYCLDALMKIHAMTYR